PLPAITVVSPWVSVPAGSPASRPVIRICGLIADEDTEYPIAMFAAWSLAALPSHRKFASGAKVPDWNSDGVVVTPRSSYQRRPTLEPTVTEWFNTLASRSPEVR